MWILLATIDDVGHSRCVTIVHIEVEVTLTLVKRLLNYHLSQLVDVVRLIALQHIDVAEAPCLDVAREGREGYIFFFLSH